MEQRSGLWCVVLLVVSLVLATGCRDEEPQEGDVGVESDVSEDTSPDAEFEVPEGTSLRFDPASREFYDLPFPEDLRLRDGFAGAFSDWPGTEEIELLNLWFGAAEELLEGWSLISGLFTYFSDPLNGTTLPGDARETVSLEQNPSVYLIDVDPESPALGELTPISCQYRPEAGSFHVADQVACISPFGVTRRPATRYALVFTSRVLDSNGEAIVPDEAMARLLAGQVVAGVEPDKYLSALEVIAEAGGDTGEVASLALFTTHDPSVRLRRVNQWYRTLPIPEIDASRGLEMVEVFEDYAVLQGYYDVPVIQEGERPYALTPAGNILFDEEGEILQVGVQSIRFFLTVPFHEMPEAGYPVLLYMHGSGGVADELMHRGPRPEPGEPAEPGTGPAGVVAPYGIAGFAADFNLHGMRHTPPDRTGLMLYNLIGNPRAAIDNFIIGANEVGLHARLLGALEFAPDDVEGLAELLPASVTTLRFDGDWIAAMGQSMGSTIGLPGLTVDDRIRAGIFSGSGGVLIETALKSTRPLNVGAALRALLGYEAQEPFDEYDPMLSAVQHLWDLVDPIAHGRFLLEEPHGGIPAKHALQHSGLEDGYFSPESRAAFSTAIGAEIVEPLVEDVALLPMELRGLDTILTLPAGGNRAGVTALVTQYEPSVLDGHNVAFQREDTQVQYACFIMSLGMEAAPRVFSAETSIPGECLR